jgi:hypothetical protein
VGHRFMAFRAIHIHAILFLWMVVVPLDVSISIAKQ